MTAELTDIIYWAVVAWAVASGVIIAIAFWGICIALVIVGVGRLTNRWYKKHIAPNRTIDKVLKEHKKEHDGYLETLPHDPQYGCRQCPGDSECPLSQWCDHDRSVGA